MDKETSFAEYLIRAKPRFDPKGRRRSQRPSIDRVVDVAFGETLPAAMKLLKQHGLIATYASDAQPDPTIPFWPLIFLSATIRFVDVYGMSRQAPESAIESTTKGLEEGWLKTTIASRFSLEQIVEAHEATESGKTVGKLSSFSAKRCSQTARCKCLMLPGRLPQFKERYICRKLSVFKNSVGLTS